MRRGSDAATFLLRFALRLKMPERLLSHCRPCIEIRNFLEETFNRELLSTDVQFRFIWHEETLRLVYKLVRGDDKLCL